MARSPSHGFVYSNVHINRSARLVDIQPAHADCLVMQHQSSHHLLYYEKLSSRLLWSWDRTTPTGSRPPDQLVIITLTATVAWRVLHSFKLTPYRFWLMHASTNAFIAIHLYAQLAYESTDSKLQETHLRVQNAKVPMSQTRLRQCGMADL